MTTAQQQRLVELLKRLEVLEARKPEPAEEAACAIARNALLDEISRVAERTGLAVYRKGRTLDAIHLTA